MIALYRTPKGVFYLGNSENILKSKYFRKLRNKINLIFTSPPFQLIKKKAYGNYSGTEYVKWLSQFGIIFNELLTDNGSLVIELGNAWQSGSPTMSLLPLKSLMGLKETGDFHLCQEFIWFNTTKLPTPAQWVNIERIRVKDAFTRLWWLSPSERPKANNRNILIEYSDSMKKLLRHGKYNFGKRPSEHNIGKDSFLKNNYGAIPSNVLPIPHTISNDPYLQYCRENNIPYHPARMPIKLAAFFIHFLTDKGDIVLDPFAGSNVTGYVAEKYGRRWRSIENDVTYAISSRARFQNDWLISSKS